MTEQQPPTTSPLRTLALVTGFAAAAALAVGLLEQTTRERVEANRFQHAMRLITEVLPGIDYDNEPARSSVQVVDADLPGAAAGAPAYFAERDGTVVATVLSVTANDGYVGPIRLLIGFDQAGRVLRVRVSEHRETPGLGDKIEIRRSEWIGQFDGRPADATTALALRRDGGELDQITGATVTSRAVTRAVQGALAWQAEHGAELIARHQAATKN